jgi:hypothetical protein
VVAALAGLAHEAHNARRSDPVVDADTRKDWDDALAIAMESRMTQVEAEAHGRKLFDDAMAFVAENQNSIERIASHLLEHDEVVGAQVRELL